MQPTEWPSPSPLAVLRPLRCEQDCHREQAMTGSASTLCLAGTPKSAGCARHWLRECLVGDDSERVEIAELLLSELVTNAVVHGRDPIEVALETHCHAVGFRVVDRSPSLPVIARYSAEAATGRGLRLVSELASSWGVGQYANGKIVWAVVADERESLIPVTGQGWSLLTDIPADLGPPVTGSIEDPIDARPSMVAMLGVPVSLFWESSEHGDALLREFGLVASGADGAAVPGRLLALATELRARLGREQEETRRQVREAELEGRSTVDISLSFPRGEWSVLRTLGLLLDEADEYCRQGHLLTLVASEEVRQFRRWTFEEIVRQLEGHAATPWGARAAS